MTLARAALVLAGIGMLGFGVATLATTLSLEDLVWLAVWLAAAIVIHDGVLVPLLSVLRAGERRGARRWPKAVTALIEVAFAVVAVLTLFVVPELWAQGRSPNPTLLTGDYAARLAVAWAVAALGAVAGARVLIRLSTRVAARR